MFLGMKVSRSVTRHSETSELAGKGVFHAFVSIYYLTMFNDYLSKSACSFLMYNPVDAMHPQNPIIGHFSFKVKLRYCLKALLLEPYLSLFF